MKRRRKQRGIGSLCLVVCLLWGLFGSSAAAGEMGKTSLEGAAIYFLSNDGSFLSEPTVVYDGQPQTPKVIVMDMKDLTTLQGTEYTISYTNNVDAGVATVTVTGIGAYTGSVEKTFQITPRTLDAENLSLEFYVKEYDGTPEAAPEITINGLISGDQVEATTGTASFQDSNVGSEKVITASDIQLSGPDSGNYVLEERNLVLTGNNGQITPQLPRLQQEAELAKGYTLDLRTLLSPSWQGEASFTLIGETLGCVLNGTQLTAGETTGQVTIYPKLTGKDINRDGEQEYCEDGDGKKIVVSIVDKESQPLVDGGTEGSESPENPQQPPLSQTPQTQEGFTLSGPTVVTYGQTIRLTASGGAGSGQVSYWVEPRGQRGQAVIDQQGLLTATQTGTVLVYAKKEGDDRYKEARANPLEVTIQPASITITVRDRTIQVGDPAPTFTAKDYTVSGLAAGDTLAAVPTLFCSPAPDLSQPGRTAIEARGAQVPVGGNYSSQITYVPGTLVIQALPTYAITLQKADLGQVTASHPQALPGTEVTLTSRPDQDCTLEKLTVQGVSGKVPLWEAGEGQYTFVMPEEAVTVTAVFAREEPEPEPEPGPLPFQDVQPWHWYYEDVDYVYRLGLMQGTEATRFSPDGVTTRGMLVTILYRMEGSPQGAGWAPFADVDPEAYYSTPVGWAAWYGIVNGYSATSFGPNDQITREQLATILYRYGQYKGWDLSVAGPVSTFADWNTSHIYARPALTWAISTSLLQGKGQGMLDPLGPASRAQVAALLHRVHASYLAEEAAV